MIVLLTVTAAGSKTQRATPALNEPPADTTAGSKTQRATPTLNEHPTDTALAPRTRSVLLQRAAKSMALDTLPSRHQGRAFALWPGSVHGR